MLEAVKKLHVQVEIIVDSVDEETIKHRLSPLPSKGWTDNAAKIHNEVMKYLKAQPPLGKYDIHNIVNKYFHKAVDKKTIVDIVDKEAIKHIVSPLPSNGWKGKVTAINEQLKGYSDKTLSTSEILDMR
ncbi:hypothetical protein ACH5RR_033046 [Cinchona calisaya]|uniref:Uncharacterized protein n=1 Tax=Cinchona calisaya TaxID=153742 RepID=A0ABD2YM70_9GENT